MGKWWKWQTWETQNLLEKSMRVRVPSSLLEPKKFLSLPIRQAVRHRTLTPVCTGSNPVWAGRWVAPNWCESSENPHRERQCPLKTACTGSGKVPHGLSMWRRCDNLSGNRTRIFSWVGYSSRLITESSWVQVPEDPFLSWLVPIGCQVRQRLWKKPGSIVKRLRHRPFTAIPLVRSQLEPFPLSRIFSYQEIPAKYLSREDSCNFVVVRRAW